LDMELYTMTAKRQLNGEDLEILRISGDPFPTAKEGSTQRWATTTNTSAHHRILCMMNYGLPRTMKDLHATQHNVNGQPTVLSPANSREKVVVASPKAGEALNVDMKYSHVIGENLPNGNRAIAIAHVGLLYLLVKSHPQTSGASMVNIVHLEEVPSLTTGPVEVASAETGEATDVNRASIVGPLQSMIIRSTTIPSHPDYLFVIENLVSATRRSTCKTTIFKATTRHMRHQSLFIPIGHG
jgi:hypothetical protein